MKLRYKIKSCSSSHANYPVSNLFSQTSHWQSARFCEYPQQITIQFYEPVSINSIKIVSHPTKIPSRVNILYHLPAHQDEGFAKYGYVTFSDNSESNHTAKQIKMLTQVNIQAIELRFLLLRNHQNLNNFFNQVALNSIVIEGTGYDYVIPGKIIENKSFSLQFLDSKILLLNQFKQKFAKSDQFQQAKQVKQVLNYVKKTGVKLSSLDLNKKSAIKQQNYNEAKNIKEEMDKIKEKITYIVNNFYDPQKKMLRSFRSDDKIREKIQSLNLYKNNSMVEPSKKILSKNTSQQDLNKNQFLQNQQQIISQDQEEQQENELLKQSRISHDDRVIPALINKIKASGQSNLHPSQTADNQFFQNSQKVAPILPEQPETLSPSDQANSSHLLEFYEPIFIKKLYSKYWQFKLEALNQVLNECKTINGRLSKSKIRALLFIYCQGVKSGNYQLANCAFQIMANVASKSAEGDFKADLHNQFEKTIILTCNKLTDSNQKIKLQAEKSMALIIASSIFGVNVCYSSIAKVYQDKIKNSPKIRKVLLENLENLLEKYGLGGNGGVPIGIVDFSVKAAADPNNEVRKSATNLLKVIKNKGGKQRINNAIFEDNALKSSIIRQFSK